MRFITITLKSSNYYSLQSGWSERNAKTSSHASKNQCALILKKCNANISLNLDWALPSWLSCAGARKSSIWFLITKTWCKSTKMKPNKQLWIKYANKSDKNYSNQLACFCTTKWNSIAVRKAKIYSSICSITNNQSQVKKSLEPQCTIKTSYSHLIWPKFLILSTKKCSESSISLNCQMRRRGSCISVSSV